MITDLRQGRDDVAVLDMMFRAADYSLLEKGRAPVAGDVSDFFASCVPGGDLAEAVKLGYWQGDVLLGFIEMSFGYPEATDAYIGLLMLDNAARGGGIGPQLLAEATARARAKGARRQLMAVLEANPKAKAFWQREGFAPERFFPASANDPLGHARCRMTRDLR
ncbi:GNAT family N-acetyltransferase [Pseudorhodobacter ferrugineus]|uniref:GNAT family N-acetyltransferase n=1 Tax=Pseudorhodobacter ferrugineus TaxID=77008 RepID=UPI0003B4B7B5|nr:GNAT family N-acetyltransferase [Pseudorhodobacter ferrugineus]